MDAELRGRQLEDQPVVPEIDVLPAEDIAEDGPYRVRLGGVDQSVDTGDRHRAILGVPRP
jgi:hypothetical protein